MTSLLFEHSEWLAGCTLLVGTVALGCFIAQALARRRVRTLLGSFGRLRPAAIRSDLLLVLALALAALALLGPRIGERTVLVSTRGADVVLLLDVSQSMDAGDVPPSRMVRARAAASELLERLEPEDRVALAAFAGRGVLLTPLTPDAAALREMLPALDTSLIRPAASDLGEGVHEALTAFEEASERPRILVLLSDGETASRDTGASASDAVRAQVRVLSIALGSEAGATIPDQGDELRDSTGHVVVSRRRTEPLDALSNATDGRSFHGDEWGRVDLAEVVREIGRDARGRPGELIERRIAAPLVLPFAALALLLLWAELLPPTSISRALTLLPALRSRHAPKPRSSVAAVALGLGLLLFAPEPGPAAAEEQSDVQTEAERASAVARALEELARTRELSARELLLLGLARAGGDRWEEAENNFLAAAMLASDGDIAGVAYHDLGVAALRRGELERARTLFFDSLALRPADLETRFNLEWTIAALEVKTPEEPPPIQAPAPAPKPDEAEDRPLPPAAAASAERDEETEKAADEQEHDAAGGRESDATDGQRREGADASRTQTPELSDAQRERWIQRIEDDASKALRSAANDAEPRKARKRNAPAW